MCAGHALRLAPGERGVAVGEGNRLAHHLVGRAAVELQVARQGDRIGAALLERLAHVQRLQTRQFVGLLQHQRAHPVQHAATLGGRLATPGAVQRRLRCDHRSMHIGCVATGDLRQRLAVRGIDQHQPAATGTRAPAAGDEDLGGFKRDVVHGRQPEAGGRAETS
jgi:hypothetical protein